MLKLESVAVFVAVAESGSITGAARRLGLPKSVVSERLSELERALGAVLLQRTTRKQSLTETGTAFLGRARNLLREADDAVAEVAERSGALVGPLRLSAPVTFGALHLSGPVCSFLQEHPRVELSLELDDRFVDAAADGFDAVIRHGPVHDTRLAAKQLASSRRFLVASPDYLAKHGVPGTAAALHAHKAILYANRPADWLFKDPSGSAVVIRATPTLRVNNGLMMRDAALAGLGIALLPTFIVHREIADGRLRIIDIGHEAEGAVIHLAHPSGRNPSAKVRALTEHLRRAFGSPPYWAGPHQE